MNSENLKINFPLWPYLNQPIFSSTAKLVLNPRRFARYHRVELLQRCWFKECDSKGRPCN